MARLIPVNKERHGTKSWRRFTSFSFAAQDHVATIVGAEISKAATSMPLAFARVQERYVLVAVLSLEPGRNLFVSTDGRWIGSYVPSGFQGFPFRLARGEGREDLVLCVYEDSGLVFEDRKAGEPFFDDGGEISKSLKRVMDFLLNVETNRKATEVAVSALAEAEVIVPWSLKAGNKKIEGLYRIDETKLQKVENSVFLGLRPTGAIPLAYAQLFSIANIAVLERLANVQEKIGATEAPKPMVFNDGDFIRFDE